MCWSDLHKKLLTGPEKTWRPVFHHTAAACRRLDARSAGGGTLCTYVQTKPQRYLIMQQWSTKLHHLWWSWNQSPPLPEAPRRQRRCLSRQADGWWFCWRSSPRYTRVYPTSPHPVGGKQKGVVCRRGSTLTQLSAGPHRKWPGNIPVSRLPASAMILWLVLKPSWGQRWNPITVRPYFALGADSRDKSSGLNGVLFGCGVNIRGFQRSSSLSVLVSDVFVHRLGLKAKRKGAFYRQLVSQTGRFQTSSNSLLGRTRRLTV